MAWIALRQIHLGKLWTLTPTSESNLWSVVEKKWRHERQGRGAVGGLRGRHDGINVVQGCLDRIVREWSCSQPEWVNLEKWIKFCGFKLRWSGRGLLLGQPTYIGELAHRHGVQQPRPVPFSKPEVPEGAEVSAEAVKKAQHLVGSYCGFQ